MGAGKKPDHCKGCLSFHSAGRKEPKPNVLMYNAWCCSKGDRADKSVAYCKQHGLKRVS